MSCVGWTGQGRTRDVTVLDDRREVLDRRPHPAPQRASKGPAAAAPGWPKRQPRRAYRARVRAVHQQDPPR